MTVTSAVLSVVAAIALGSPLALYIISAYVKYVVEAQKPLRRGILAPIPSELKASARIVGFFHPYCNAGGGGERVLWTALAHIQRTQPTVACVVYSGDIDAGTDDQSRKAAILGTVQKRMGIELDAERVHFVFLTRRRWVEDSTWPRFTLLGQSVGSMLLAWEATGILLPDIYIDTMGYAFTFPIVAIVATLAGRTVPIGAYVHYPTISTTMLNRVQSRAAGVTNSSTVASSPVLSRGKLWYYIGFMHLYSSCLHLASFLMTNSSWTDAHVRSVLAFKPPALLGLVSQLITWPLSIKLPSSLPKSKTISTKTSSKSQAPSQNATLSTRIVYPPCDTGAIATFPLTGRSPLVLSIAQFRPEKDHATQLRAFALLLKRYEQQQQKGHGDDVEGHPKLVLVGGARNPSDLARVAALQALAASFDITPHVTFAVNAPYPEMLALLKTASVGIHTMIDEHFGISVVELMAAGVVPVAHKSAGPLLDIVVPVEGGRTGYLAGSDEEFAEGLAAVLGVGVGVVGSVGSMKEHEEEVRAMRERGRRHAAQAFNEEAFCAGWDASGWRDWL